MNKITCIKRYTDLPFAHRQPNHKGHCSLIHGHNWSFEFEFEAKAVDSNGFVIDFGDLKWLRALLEEHFDHTLVLNEDDPLLSYLADALTIGHGGCGLDPIVLARIVTVPNCGAEGLAVFVLHMADEKVRRLTNDRVRVKRITVFEDTRNSATYTID